MHRQLGVLQLVTVLHQNESNWTYQLGGPGLMGFVVLCEAKPQVRAPYSKIATSASCDRCGKVENREFQKGSCPDYSLALLTLF